MTDNDEILFSNAAFYQAFLDKDIAAMETLWAVKLPVLCIHPGSPPLAERERVMASWRDILAHEQCPALEHQVDRIVHYNEVSLLTCYEWNKNQPKAALLATNGFAREDGVYRMILHHAGPVPRSAIPAVPRQDARVH